MLMDGINLLAGKATTTQTYKIDSAVCDGLASCDDVGRDLFAALASALYHHVATDAAELVDEYGRADDCEVVYDNLTSELGLVTNDTAITYDSIVCYVYALHEKVVAAYDSSTLGCCASVDGYIFTDGVVVTNLCCSLFATELEVLRYSTDDCAGEYGVAIANARTVEDVGIGHDDVVVANHNITVNVHEGTNLHILADNGFGVDIC